MISDRLIFRHLSKLTVDFAVTCTGKDKPAPARDELAPVRFSPFFHQAHRQNRQDVP